MSSRSRSRSPLRIEGAVPGIGQLIQVAEEQAAKGLKEAIDRFVAATEEADAADGFAPIVLAREHFLDEMETWRCDGLIEDFLCQADVLVHARNGRPHELPAALAASRRLGDCLMDIREAYRSLADAAIHDAFRDAMGMLVSRGERRAA